MTFEVTVKLAIDAKTQSEALSEVEKRLRAGTPRPAEDPACLMVLETITRVTKNGR